MSTGSYHPCASATAGQEDGFGKSTDGEEYKGPEVPAELETLKSESLSTVAAAAIAARAAAAARLREEEQKRRTLEEEAVGAMLIPRLGGMLVSRHVVHGSDSLPLGHAHHVGHAPG
jgi:hypothetical protein